jgi:hypothetical protein
VQVSDETPEPTDLQEVLDSLVSRPQTPEEFAFIGELILRGFSPAAVDLKYYDRFGKRLDRNWLDSVHRRLITSGEPKRYQEEAEEVVLATGLAMKVERVRRLMEYVETIEPAALTNPSKVGIEYRRGIQQIKEEVEGLGFDVVIAPGDAFAQLLLEIKALGERTLEVEHVDLGTGEVDAGDPGSTTE